MQFYILITVIIIGGSLNAYILYHFFKELKEREDNNPWRIVDDQFIVEECTSNNNWREIESVQYANGGECVIQKKDIDLDSAIRITSNKGCGYIKQGKAHEEWTQK